MKINELSSNNDLNQAISKLYSAMTDKYDFCYKLVSLDLNEAFGKLFEEDDTPVAELFNLCIQYLDKTIQTKDLIWGQIEAILRG